VSGAVHPSAFVSPDAVLGENVSIGPCAVIEEDVVIGDNCQVHAFASIKRHTRMGTDNIVHSYAAVGGIPQDLKFAGEVSHLEIGNHNSIREFASLHRGTAGGGGCTRVGDNNLLMAYTHVAHDCQIGNGVVLSNNATLAGHVVIQDGAILGGLCAVHQFSRIGRHAFVGGMTGVAQDLPPYMLAVGGRSGIHGPNIVGLRRLRVPPATLTAMRAAFRTIWLSGIPRKEALAQVEREYPHIPQILELVAFVRESPRGVLAAVRQTGNGDETD
jgi:UDP-N-acetylglucosamine acyltransferase